MGGGHSSDGLGPTYKGFAMHQPKRWHALTGKGMCAIMWNHTSTKMSIFLCFLFILLSCATACDRCVYQTNAAYFTSSAPLSSGACGYGSLAQGFNGGYLAGGGSSLYRDGVGCGGCFQIRCKREDLCTRRGTKIILFDFNRNSETGFVLSSKAYKAMARNGKDQDISKLGIVDVEYKRIPCNYKNQNLSLRVEELSRKPNSYIAVKFLFQGGQTDIVTVGVAQVGSSNWGSMSRNYGAVWDMSQVPVGPLQFRLEVIAGYDVKQIWAKNALPADWNSGLIYDSGVQISDIAQESCSPCDVKKWK